MIIATAGHVDHGKTALVKQLTGVDTDRLEEEKRRGLSISLGYAYLPRGEDTPIGFVDVPGHHRFINNMISGISGIDMGLLVVAADDGPMPQTREHLDVLRMLGVDELVTVISKVDRVGSERCDEVKGELRRLLEEMGWYSPLLFAISNTTGSGIDALRDHLLGSGQRRIEREARGNFRLSVDRVFTVKGAGVVVTGTVSTGRVALGDTLRLQPANIETRVRGLRVHDREAISAQAGHRCALNLTGGVERDDVTRGDWLLALEVAAPSRRLDITFTLLPGAPFALKHLSPVKLYLGAGRFAGRIALLRTDEGDKRLHAGDTCLAQLVLETPVPAFTGQRFLLRDHAENVLLGGGTVLDPNGNAGRQSQPDRLARLDAMAAPTPETALARLAALGGLVDLTRFRTAWNLREDEETGMRVDQAQVFNSEGSQWLVSRSRWDETGAALMDRVMAWHREHPQETGIKASALRKSLEDALERPLLMALVSDMLERGTLALRDGRLHMTGFRAVVPEGHRAAWQQVQSCLVGHGRRIPLLSELSAETGIPLAEIEQAARDPLKENRLFRVSSRRYALPAQLLEFSRAVIDLNDAGESLSVIALKGCWGVGRNLAVEVLEFFDSIRFTRREGNVRVVINAEVPAQLFNA